jgi:hypothetical protein
MFPENLRGVTCAAHSISGLSSMATDMEFLIHLSLGCIVTVLYRTPPHVMSHSGRQSIIFSLSCLYIYMYLYIYIYILSHHNIL